MAKALACIQPSQVQFSLPHKIPWTPSEVIPELNARSKLYKPQGTAQNKLFKERKVRKKIQPHCQD